MKKISLFLFILYVFSACSTNTPPATPEVITIYSTAAAEPWLSELYDCSAQQNNVVLFREDDPSSADIVLRVGEPKLLSSFAYQIDTEEVKIVTQRQSPVQNLDLDEARALFAGLGDPSLQVWVYPSGDDVQEVFDRFVMDGRSVSPSAYLAANPQQMSDMLVNESNTVGILPEHWKMGDSREVFSVATVPVLVLTQNEPQGAIQELIACLEN